MKEHTCKHQHHNHYSTAQAKLKISIGLLSIIFIAEIVGGILSNSLALLSDAIHLFTDLASLLIALIAIKISRKAPSDRMTYGYHRVTILAALFNGLTLIVTAIYICYEAYGRILNAQPINGATVITIAIIGLIINICVGMMLHSHSDNVNIKGAMLHVFGDAIASVGVIISGVIIQFTGFTLIDPITSVTIALIITFGAVKLLKEVYYVIMEATPNEISFKEVLKEISEVNGVLGVHDLHIWSLTSNRNYMSVHIHVDEKTTIDDIERIIQDINSKIEEKFSIEHSTIQFERKPPKPFEMFYHDQ